MFTNMFLQAFWLAEHVSFEGLGTDLKGLNRLRDVENSSYTYNDLLDKVCAQAVEEYQ